MKRIAIIVCAVLIAAVASAGDMKHPSFPPGVHTGEPCLVGQANGCNEPVADPFVAHKINPKNLDCSDSIGPFNGVWSGLLNAADCPGATAGAKIQAAANTALANGGGLVNYNVTAGGSALVTSQLSFGDGVYFMLNGVLFDTTVVPTGQVQFTGSGGGMVCDGLPRYPDPSNLPSGTINITSCSDTAGVATCPWTGTAVIQAGATMLTITGNTVSGYNLTHVLVTATPTASSLSFPVANGLGVGTGGTAVWGTIEGSGIIAAPASGLSPIVQFQPNVIAGGSSNTNPRVQNCAFMETAQVADDIDSAPNMNAEWVNINGNVFGGFSATDHPPGWAVSIAPFATGVTNSVNLADNYAYYHGFTTIPLTSCAEVGTTAKCLTASAMPAFYASLGGWPGYIYGVTGDTGYNIINSVEVEFTYFDSTHVTYTAASSGLGAGSGGALYFGGAFQSNAGNTQGPNNFARNTGFLNGGPVLSVGPAYSFDPLIEQNSCAFPLATYVNEDVGFHVQDVDALTMTNNPTECYDISRAGGTHQIGMVFVSSGAVVNNTLTGNQSTSDSTQDTIYGIFSNKSAFVTFAGNKITSNLTAGWQSVGGATNLVYLPNQWTQGPHDGSATEFGASTNGLTWVCPSNSNPALNGYCGTKLNAAANPSDLSIGNGLWFAGGNFELDYNARNASEFTLHGGSLFVDSGSLKASIVGVSGYFSVAGSALPSCAAATYAGQWACVTDETSACTAGNSYAGSGTHSCQVQCNIAGNTWKVTGQACY